MDRLRSLSMLIGGCLLAMSMHSAPAADSAQRLLFEAAWRGDLEGAMEALEAGVNINARDEEGWTALM
ncbi:hypothetical protein LRF89_07675, partial [Halorhodospira sp. 9621]|nr:hypothetical protein [Halorhodospira sp. 9621]